MNKKGYFSNFIFGFIGLFVLILVLVSLISVEKSNISYENISKDFDVTYNKTSIDFAINNNNSVIINVIYSFLDFIVYSSFEVAKLGLKYGIEHPEIVNPIILLWIIIISLLAPLIFIAIKLGLIIYIFIKDFIQNRREKKSLLSLKQQHNEINSKGR